MTRIDEHYKTSSVSWIDRTTMLKRRLWSQEIEYVEAYQGIPAISKLHDRLRDIFVPFDYGELK